MNPPTLLFHRAGVSVAADAAAHEAAANREESDDEGVRGGEGLSGESAREVGVTRGTVGGEGGGGGVEEGGSGVRQASVETGTLPHGSVLATMGGEKASSRAGGVRRRALWPSVRNGGWRKLAAARDH